MAAINSGGDQSEMILHGDLDLKIIEARRLPNMDVVNKHFRTCFAATKACVTPPPAAGDTATTKKEKLQEHRRIITSDAYVTVSVPQVTLARTRVMKNSANPQWNQKFCIMLAHPFKELEFRVKDNDLFGAELIGSVKIPVEKIASGELISGWFPIIGPTGKPPKPDTALHIEMQYLPLERNPLYRHGIAGDPEQKGVRETYFPLRKGSQVTLYQDAHVTDGILPEIKLDGGKVFKQQQCWEDICYAISEAHHMIYITGWSIYHKVKLVREPTRPLPRGGDFTLGDLLKYKSEEGVRVLLLVWDDKSSLSGETFFVETAGMMGTHDEETKKFFKHSSVTCVLSPRYASNKLGFLKQQLVGTIFTHHQKCVLVDTQASGNNRKITAFIGGLDLTDGRYDTPEHRLFRDLNTAFHEDFHNPTFPAGHKVPREPWHDLHCRIEGPAAYDLLINFEQRWRKSTKWSEFSLRFKTKSHWKDDSLIKIERISWILSPPQTVLDDGNTVVPNDDPLLWVRSEDNPEHWHVQIFRSIDSSSVKGFPKYADEAEAQNLIVAKNQVIERSIQRAYVQAIRSAQHYIYIENQYFLGSSYAWPSYKDAGADNLIPMELALKIVSKIKTKERFAVYIVIPMWPEGDPKTGAMQEILYWQSQTMEMMYRVIAKELKKHNVDAHPQDYLNFYCLGNREEMPKEMASNNGDKVTITDAYKFQRFMIYVHAKGMVVDDEYVIVGSANINQRSMAGSKDTELAMGAYQPHYTWAKNHHPRGQVYGYRMSLWAEHLGMLHELFNEPESLDCVRMVNKVADENWMRYTDNEFKLLQGHLLKYPLHVEVDGSVSSLPGYETFPDAGGKILGAQSVQIPDVLTT